MKGRRADPLAQRLVTAYATETLLLADPSDLPYDAALLDDDSLVDEAKMRAAHDDLIPAKSHLASHTPRNDVGRAPATTSSTSASRTCCAPEPEPVCWHNVVMTRRNVNNDPILDANDVLWWIGFGFLATVPLVIVRLMGWPIWLGLPIALSVGVASAPLHKRYRRRSESNRPRA